MGEHIVPVIGKPGEAALPVEALGPQPAKYDQELSRSLTFRENILITLSSVTPASSVFVIVPAAINGIGGAAGLAFAIAAVIGLTIGLCYAELSSAFPITGGEYAFIARTVGRPAGFALFVLTLVNGAFICGVIASGAGTYLGVVWGALSGKWVGIAVIVVTSVVACLRIRTNAWVTGLFLAIEMTAVAVLCVLGFAHAHQPIATLWKPQTADHHGVLVGAGAGLVVSYMATALFAYNGYGTAVYYAEETKQATRTIGRAIMWSLLITVAAELIPLVAVLLGAPSLSKLVASPAPMTYFLESRGGTAINDIVSIGIAIAIINAVLAIVLQLGRLLFSSARDRSWPDVVNRPLASIDPRFKTPMIATLTVGIAGALLFWLVSFNTLLIVTGASLLITYMLVGLGTLVGRINGRTSHAAFKLPGWPAVPALTMIATIVVAYETWKSGSTPVIVAVSIFVAALPYYFLYLHPRRGDRWTLPDPADEELE